MSPLNSDLRRWRPRYLKRQIARSAKPSMIATRPIFASSSSWWGDKTSIGQAPSASRTLTKPVMRTQCHGEMTKAREAPQGD